MLNEKELTGDFTLSDKGSVKLELVCPKCLSTNREDFKTIDCDIAGTNFLLGSSVTICKKCLVKVTVGDRNE